MNAADWEDVREEVCTHLEIGIGRGETELDTMTKLLWLERQNTLKAIEKAVAAAIDRERGLVGKKAKVLEWKSSMRTQLRKPPEPS